MSYKQKAITFAINAHKGQKRKHIKDKPMVTHVLSVGNILEEFDFNEEIITAGILHDIIEDTPYDNNYIKTEFNEKIANLVKGCTEIDKSFSWKKRKEEFISRVKFLSFENKAIICADKIDNLEDILINNTKNGKKDFSCFNSTEKDQKWFYSSVYESLIYKENKDYELFARLKRLIDKVFNDKENLFLKDIFKDNLEDYNKLKKIDAMKYEVYKMKKLIKINKPFVIEFSGTPRTGKTSVIKNINDFFKKGNFSVDYIKEFASSNYYKKEFLPKINSLSIKEKNNVILLEIERQLKKHINFRSDIIIADRSINDRFIWENRIYNKTNERPYLNSKVNTDKIRKYKDIIDILIVLHTDSYTSLKRDYIDSLALEPRNFLNIENITNYNESMEEMIPILSENVKILKKIDTTNISQLETAITVASEILTLMHDEYLRKIIDKYD